MTHDERLMLVAQGAADPELMGADVHRPVGVSAAEAMREAAAIEAVKLGMTIRAVGSKEFADCAKMVNFIGSVADMMEGLGVVIDTIPLPADPRDAITDSLVDILVEVIRTSIPDQRVADDYFAAVQEAGRRIAKARAALAQSGDAP